MGFIKSRLNKDNFWNLMFLVATASGIMFSEWLMAIPEVSLVGLLTLITSLTFVPWLMISLNSVSWVGGKAFVSKQGRLINTKPLKWLLLVFPAIAGSIVVVPDFLEILFSSQTLDRFIITLVFTSFLIAPVLFFILINCPISILFNRNSYCPSVNGMKFQQSNFGSHRYSSPTSSPTPWEKTISPHRDYYSFNKDEYYYSYAYRHLGSNINRNR